MKKYIMGVFVALLAVGLIGILTADADATGPSAFCHETDGAFTTCVDGSHEWSDVGGASFFDVFGALLSVLYVDQADKDPSRSIPDGSGLDTLMLMYDEVQRTVPLSSEESVHVHFMTVDEGMLVHYDVFIGTGGIQKVLINDVEQIPMPSGLTGLAGFGASPNNATPHVIAEFQIGLEAAGFTSEECCYSPDPAWWGSGVPENPQPKECPGDRDCDQIPDEQDPCPGTPGVVCQPPPDCPPEDVDCDGVPNEADQCPLEPGPHENGGCPILRGEPGEEVTTSAAIVTANLDGTTVVDPEPLLSPGEEPPLCETIGRIVDFRVPPNGVYKNHGDYMRRVAQLTESLVQSQVDASIISPEEAEELQSCVVHARAKSAVGK